MAKKKTNRNVSVRFLQGPPGTAYSRGDVVAVSALADGEKRALPKWIEAGYAEEVKPAKAQAEEAEAEAEAEAEVEE